MENSQEPINPNSPEANMPPPEKKRGGCLTAFLILMLIANPLVAIIYLVGGKMVMEKMPNLAPWMLGVLIVGAVLNFLFALAVWNWRKIGVYGFAVTAPVVFVLNLSIGLNIFQALLGLIGLVLLIALVRPVWNQMK